MSFLPTDEMKELKKVFSPYLKNGIMSKEAPQEAIDAIENYFELENELKREEIRSWFE